MQDLAIVGLGLIGSAALRHAAGDADVIGIGPAEPDDWAVHEGPFASHYDSGRITRGIDARLEWAVLARRAIAQYPVIEAASGMTFHRGNGVIFVRNDQAGIDRVSAVADRLGLAVTVGPVSSQVDDRPELTLPADWTAIREGDPAGDINPRSMIDAQIVAANARGALVARDTVVSIRPAQSGLELLTAAGRTHQARRVLIAAGAYSNRFLPEPLAVAVRPEVVVLGEVSERQANDLAAMPSVLYLLDHPELDDVYIVPPALYPDGRWYVKIGGSQRMAGRLDNRDAMNEWMRSDRADAVLPAMRAVLRSVLADVEFGSWTAKPCLITDTASGLPYIDRLEDGTTVAFGGNGHAAKSADAIGALASGLALGDGTWNDSELDADVFAARFGDYTPPTGSRHGT